jgi:hypothetical protein
MGEYYAWAATGVVAGLESWSEPDFGPEAGSDAVDTGAVRIASRLVERQKFYLRQRDGRDIEVSLIDCPPLLREGHLATAVWAARKGATHGFCLHLENHTTGARTRLPHNIDNIRTKAGIARTAKYGLFATAPAAVAMLAWLLIPGTLDQIDMNWFVLGATAAFVVLFIIGLIVAKLVLDYFQADDDQKVWQSVDDILMQVHAGLRQPAPRPRTRA